MKKKSITDILENTYIRESYDMDASGMMSRVPPMHTEEVEVTDEEADKQAKKSLAWSLTNKK